MDFAARAKRNLRGWLCMDLRIRCSLAMYVWLLEAEFDAPEMIINVHRAVQRELHFGKAKLQTESLLIRLERSDTGSE
jgi:hypothetical protein